MIAKCLDEVMDVKVAADQEEVDRVVDQEKIVIAGAAEPEDPLVVTGRKKAKAMPKLQAGR